ACGTAGFLISAYKHILKANDALSPDERAQLMANFRGYDIAPDMVRLSRVNLYLHGCPQPVIHEYDTLTSEERWDERCDVIMANPPFMTPKGGIRPHNRFSIKAKRSEVLFVDYIAAHLNPGGRAGVIVPEGIIFQSQNAYKALRKMLVENYLWAVVSLPAGVFNPYSGVKTSILFLDRNMAKRTDNVLFVKIENDGFDLGAQRRPIEGSQLAEALAILNGHKKAQEAQESKLALTVARKRLLESPDFNLSGDRYRVTAPRHSGKWPVVKLGEVVRTVTPPKKIQKSEFGSSGAYPIIDQSQEEIAGWTDDKQAVVAPRKPVVIFGDHTCAVKYSDHAFAQGADGIKILETDTRLLPRFLFFWLRTFPVETEGYKRHFAALLRVELPLPPLDEQERIVAELEGYRKVIEGARQILASYKPTIRIDPAWPVVKLGEVSAFRNGLNYSKESKGTGLKVIGVSTFQDHLVAPIADLEEVNPEGIANDDDMLADGDLVFVRSNGNKDLVGRCLLVETGGARVSYSAFTIRLRFSIPKALPLFYAILFRSDVYRRRLSGRGANISNLSQDILRDLEIPLPPLGIQRQIVGGVEAERKLVEANRELITRMETKIKAKLAEVWGEEYD
nr:N-6 DNA methylase [Kiritimatiellia bacterium]